VGVTKLFFNDGIGRDSRVTRSGGRN